MTNKRIVVSQPSFPHKPIFDEYVQQIWDNKWLTNSGPLEKKLESELTKYLDVPYISLFNNGTQALIASLCAFDFEPGSEVITTPFSFLATTQAIKWNQLKPIFVDIDPITLNINSAAIEAAITSRTRAILAVNCYGQPCDFEFISDLANRYNLKVIYDAAHCFGIKVDGTSLLNQGDMSVLSFHATKVFSTVEGGAVVTHSRKLKEKLDAIKNFGNVEGEQGRILGLNGKLSELHAAFGLALLPEIDNHIQRRKAIHETYSKLLPNSPKLTAVLCSDNYESNYSYFPVLLKDSLFRAEIIAQLKAKDIDTRTYFYPLISHMEFISDEVVNNLPIADGVAQRILCLPLFSDMKQSEVETICTVINRFVEGVE